MLWQHRQKLRVGQLLAFTGVGVAFSLRRTAGEPGDHIKAPNLLRTRSRIEDDIQQVISRCSRSAQGAKNKELPAAIAIAQMTSSNDMWGRSDACMLPAARCFFAFVHSCLPPACAERISVRDVQTAENF